MGLYRAHTYGTSLSIGESAIFLERKVVCLRECFLVLYTVHCTLYTVHCTLYTVHTVVPITFWYLDSVQEPRYPGNMIMRHKMLHVTENKLHVTKIRILL